MIERQIKRQTEKKLKDRLKFSTKDSEFTLHKSVKYVIINTVVSMLYHL